MYDKNGNTAFARNIYKYGANMVQTNRSEHTFMHNGIINLKYIGKLRNNSPGAWPTYLQHS